MKTAYTQLAVTVCRKQDQKYDHCPFLDADSFIWLFMVAVSDSEACCDSWSQRELNECSVHSWCYFLLWVLIQFHQICTWAWKDPPIRGVQNINLILCDYGRRWDTHKGRTRELHTERPAVKPMVLKLVILLLGTWRESGVFSCMGRSHETQSCGRKDSRDCTSQHKKDRSCCSLFPPGLRWESWNLEGNQSTLYLCVTKTQGVQDLDIFASEG